MFLVDDGGELLQRWGGFFFFEWFPSFMEMGERGRSFFFFLISPFSPRGVGLRAVIVNPSPEYKRALTAAASSPSAASVPRDSHGYTQTVAHLLLRPGHPGLPRAHLPVRGCPLGRKMRQFHARGCGCGLAPLLRHRQVDVWLTEMTLSALKKLLGGEIKL